MEKASLSKFAKIKLVIILAYIGLGALVCRYVSARAAKAQTKLHRERVLRAAFGREPLLASVMIACALCADAIYFVMREKR